MVAALMAQEADGLGVLLGEVGDVVVPEPAPTHVRISRYRLTIATAAGFAMVADARGMHPKRLLEFVLEEYADAFGRRARKQDTRRTPGRNGSSRGDA